MQRGELGDRKATVPLKFLQSHREEEAVFREIRKRGGESSAWICTALPLKVAREKERTSEKKSENTCRGLQEKTSPKSLMGGKKRVSINSGAQTQSQVLEVTWWCSSKGSRAESQEQAESPGSLGEKQFGVHLVEAIWLLLGQKTWQTP